MSDQPIEIRCGHCGGTGKHELTGVHAETLVMLRQQAVPISGAALSRLAGCRMEAMANRLVYLQRLGLAKGARHGRERFWVATPSEAAP